ncbi:MAG TPA: hypothetical protein VGM39_18705, partial [Kofleriaceae bacterium]
MAHVYEDGDTTRVFTLRDIFWRSGCFAVGHGGIGVALIELCLQGAELILGLLALRDRGVSLLARGLSLASNALAILGCLFGRDADLFDPARELCPRLLRGQSLLPRSF